LKVFLQKPSAVPSCFASCSPCNVLFFFLGAVIFGFLLNPPSFSFSPRPYSNLDPDSTPRFSFQFFSVPSGPFSPYSYFFTQSSGLYDGVRPVSSLSTSFLFILPPSGFDLIILRSVGGILVGVLTFSRSFLPIPPLMFPGIRC